MSRHPHQNRLLICVNLHEINAQCVSHSQIPVRKLLMLTYCRRLYVQEVCRHVGLQQSLCWAFILDSLKAIFKAGPNAAFHCPLREEGNRAEAMSQ